MLVTNVGEILENDQLTRETQYNLLIQEAKNGQENIACSQLNSPCSLSSPIYKILRGQMKAMKDLEAPCETGSIIVLLVTLDCHKALLQTSVMTSLAEKASLSDWKPPVFCSKL